jgi:exonuclease VII small subunit
MKKHIQNFFLSTLWSIFFVSLAIAGVVIPEVPALDQMAPPIPSANTEGLDQAKMLQETQSFKGKVLSMIAKTEKLELLASFQEIIEALDQITTNLELPDVDLEAANKQSIAVAQQFQQILQTLSPEEQETLLNV